MQVRIPFQRDGCYFTAVC